MSIDLKTTFENIKTLVMQGKAMEVFETYYGEDVVMQENETPATIGKVANRQRKLDFSRKWLSFEASS